MDKNLYKIDQINKKINHLKQKVQQIRLSNHQQCYNETMNNKNVQLLYLQSLLKNEQKMIKNKNPLPILLEKLEEHHIIFMSIIKKNFYE